MHTLANYNIVIMVEFLVLKGGDFYYISYFILCIDTHVASNHHQFVVREDCYQSVASFVVRVANDLPRASCWVILVNWAVVCFPKLLSLPPIQLLAAVHIEQHSWLCE